MKTSFLKHGGKLAVTAVLLFFIFRHIDTKNTVASLTEVSLWYLLIGLLLQTACNIVAAFRWSLIMRRIDFHFPTFFYLKSYFKGAFFNQGLPTSIGGDGMRILDSARLGGSAEQAFFGVFIDRVIGLTGLLLLNISALVMNRTLLPAKVHWPLLLILISLACGLLLLFFLRRFSFFAAGKYLGFLGRLSERYFQVYSSISSICTQLTLSVLVHLLSLSTFFMIGQAVGLNFPMQVYLVLVPPVLLLTVLPLSLAGWGIREGAMVGFFLLVGADKSKVLALSVLYGMTTLTVSLPGLLIYLMQKSKL